jgi:hypothetical protein
MQALYDPARHEPLGDIEWDEGRARDGIATICRDAEAAFDPERLWPMHPRDWEPGTPEDGIMRGLYLGAAGMVHGLGRLARAGFHEPTLDHAAIADGLYEGWLESPDEPGVGPSLLAGSSGILLVTHRLSPSAETADLLAQEIAANVAHPSNELLLGAPGTMLVARAMRGPRFEKLWKESARILLARQEEDGLWTQDLYGRPARCIGTGHGFAGNVRALMDAPEWLDVVVDEGGAATVEAWAVQTVKRFATREGELVNWAPEPETRIDRVQWCHGSPGMLTSLARLAPADGEYTALLEAGGELAWRVGPLARNAGLCHGTGGNGFAFLALHDRTKDELWLDRARAFAAHALAQAGREDGWYSLYTGDLGAALLAAACIDGDSRFPGIDDL